MAKRTFTLSEDQRKELLQAYDQAQEADEQRRLQAVRLYGDGRAVKDIQDIVRCSERSLRRWCSAYDQHGLAGLTDRRAGGNRALLTTEQRQAIIQRIQTYTPDQLLPAEVRISRGTFWTVSDLRIGIQRWYGITWRSAGSYRSLLHESRWSVQQVENTYRSRPDEAEVAAFEDHLEKK